MRRLTKKEKDLIYIHLNQPEQNLKDCNFYRLIDEGKDWIKVEVGYWITYIGCRPLYQKEVVIMQKK